MEDMQWGVDLLIAARRGRWRYLSTTKTLTWIHHVAQQKQQHQYDCLARQLCIFEQRARWETAPVPLCEFPSVTELLQTVISQPLVYKCDSARVCATSHFGRRARNEDVWVDIADNAAQMSNLRYRGGICNRRTSSQGQLQFRVFAVFTSIVVATSRHHCSTSQQICGVCTRTLKINILEFGLQRL